MMEFFWEGIGFNRRYIDGYVKNSTELTPAMAKGVPDRVMWSDVMVTSFESLIAKLCKRVVLHVPREDFKN